MLRKHLVAASAASFLLCTVASADVVEVPLEFQESADATGAIPYGSAGTRSPEGLPAGDWTLPEDLGEKAIYGLLKLGESEFLFVTDVSKEGESRYDRFFLDQDGDGDLTEEPVLEGEVYEFGDGYWNTSFGETLVVDYLIDGETLPYVVDVSLHGMDEALLRAELPEGMDIDELGFGWSPSISIGTACFYSGELTLDEVTYRVRLGDTDCDGRFGETAHVNDNIRYMDARLYVEGDELYLTTGDELTYEDMMRMGDYLVLGEKTYEVEVDIADRKLVLTPIAEGLVPLRLSPVPERMVAHTKGFEHTLMMILPGETVRVPAGAYRLLSYTIFKTGERGDVWRLGANVTRRSSFTEVAAGGDAVLEFGEPFTATAEVPSWILEMEGSDGLQQVQLALNLRGAAGELVSDLARVSGEESACAMSEASLNLPLEPTYTIMKADGEIVEQGSFEYG